MRTPRAPAPARPRPRVDSPRSTGTVYHLPKSPPRPVLTHVEPEPVTWWQVAVIIGIAMALLAIGFLFGVVAWEVAN